MIASHLALKRSLGFERLKTLFGSSSRRMTCKREPTAC